MLELKLCASTAWLLIVTPHCVIALYSSSTLHLPLVQFLIVNISKCIKCNTVLNNTVINKAAKIELSPKSGTYNNKIQHPLVSVKDSKGNILEQGTDYNISWAKGMKKAGIYNIKITFTGRYNGTTEQTYKICPKGTNISNVKAKKKRICAGMEETRKTDIRLPDTVFIK